MQDTTRNYFQYLLQGAIHQQQQHNVYQESDRLLNHSSPLTPSHPVGRAQTVQKLSRWHRWGFTSVTAEFTAVPAVALMFGPFTKLLILERIFTPYFTGLKVICSYSVLCNQGGLVSRSKEYVGSCLLFCFLSSELWCTFIRESKVDTCEHYYEQVAEVFCQYFEFH